jgi:hypothetical protein
MWAVGIVESTRGLLAHAEVSVRQLSAMLLLHFVSHAVGRQAALDLKIMADLSQRVSTALKSPADLSRRLSCARSSLKSTLTHTPKPTSKAHPRTSHIRRTDSHSSTRSPIP